MRRSWLVVLSAALLVAALAPVARSAAQERTPVPDYSLTPRSEIPVEFTWRVEDLYPTFEAWERDRSALEELVSRIDGAAEGWTSSPDKMLALYELRDAIYIKGSRLFRYVLLQGDVDLGNSRFQALRGELQAAFVEIEGAFAFLEPDLLKMDEKTLGGYLDSDKRLEPYRFSIMETLRGRAHILPEEQERIVAMTGHFDGAPSRASTSARSKERLPRRGR